MTSWRAHRRSRCLDRREIAKGSPALGHAFDRQLFESVHRPRHHVGAWRHAAVLRSEQRSDLLALTKEGQHLAGENQLRHAYGLARSRVEVLPLNGADSAIRIKLNSVDQTHGVLRSLVVEVRGCSDVGLSYRTQVQVAQRGRSKAKAPPLHQASSRSRSRCAIARKCASRSPELPLPMVLRTQWMPFRRKSASARSRLKGRRFISGNQGSGALMCASALSSAFFNASGTSWSRAFSA